MKNFPFVEFEHFSGSKVWPSSDPEDSPFDKFICKNCGKTVVCQMYGGHKIGEESFYEKAQKDLVSHLNSCEKYTLKYSMVIQVGE